MQWEAAKQRAIAAGVPFEPEDFAKVIPGHQDLSQHPEFLRELEGKEVPPLGSFAQMSFPGLKDGAWLNRYSPDGKPASFAALFDEEVPEEEAVKKLYGLTARVRVRLDRLCDLIDACPAEMDRPFRAPEVNPNKSDRLKKARVSDLLWALRDDGVLALRIGDRKTALRRVGSIYRLADHVFEPSLLSCVIRDGHLEFAREIIREGGRLEVWTEQDLGALSQFLEPRPSFESRIKLGLIQELVSVIWLMDHYDEVKEHYSGNKLVVFHQPKGWGVVEDWVFRARPTGFNLTTKAEYVNAMIDLIERPENWWTFNEGDPIRPSYGMI